MADKQCFASIDVNLTESPVPIQMYREFTKNTITFFWDEIKLRFFCVVFLKRWTSLIKQRQTSLNTFIFS